MSMVNKHGVAFELAPEGPEETKSNNRKLPENSKEVMELLKNLSLVCAYFTPKASDFVLEHHNKSNYRKDTKSLWTRLSALMKGLLWLIGPVIVFDDEGELLDGQNRLRAIVASGKPQWLLVMRGLPKSQSVAFDNGKARTRAETIHNIKLNSENADKINAIVGTAPLGIISAILIAIHGGLKNASLSNVELENAILMHSDVLKFVICTFLPEDEKGKRRAKPGITRAHTVGPFGRAYIKHKNNPALLTRIKEAANKLMYGFNGKNPKEAGFDELRQWLASTGGLAGQAANQLIYYKISNCLNDYIHGRPTTFREPKWTTDPKTGRRKLIITELEKQDPFEVETGIKVTVLETRPRGRPRKVPLAAG